MDKQKHNARQARYRAKKSRLELIVSSELKEQFQTLPGTDDMTNAQKLQALCDLWRDTCKAENEDVQPSDDIFSAPGIEALDEALKSIDALEMSLSLEDFRDSGLSENHEKLRYYLNGIGRSLYSESGHVKIAKTAGRNPQFKAAVASSDALSHINANFGAAVAAAVAFDLVEIDLSFWLRMSEQQQNLTLWSAFTHYK